MDEAPTSDIDCDYRAFACELTQWLFEGSSVHPYNVAEFIAAASCIEFYITNGATVEFHCDEKLRKTVRGE
jgi:hypothetical protein